MFISSAIAQTAPAAATGGGDMMSSLTGMLPLVLMFVVLYFVMIRPQMKRQKEHRAMIDALAKGDEVATAGGLLGKVTPVETIEAAFSACSTLARVVLSTLTDARVEDTCTAGASPKKFGRVYNPPTSSAIRMITYFQTG